MISIFYDSRMSVANNDSFSPSAGKPELLMKRWKEKGYNLALCEVEPIIKEDLYQVHSQNFVDEVISCQADNGFGNRLPEIAESLLWTNGSIVTAVRRSFLDGVNVCSPTSGFHHAEWGCSMGFCTFNGLVLAALKLHKEFPETRIGILDLDMHYGNGTYNIIEKLGIDYIQHYTFGGDCQESQSWLGREPAKDWLLRLPIILKQFKDCSVVIFQAGADPHISDPYGGALTSEQLKIRDWIVFNGLKCMKIPVVWNLAGGYQTPVERVLSLHDATFEEAEQVEE